MATELVKGRNHRGGPHPHQRRRGQALDGLPQKLHCSVLAEEAVRPPSPTTTPAKGIDPAPLWERLRGLL